MVPSALAVAVPLAGSPLTRTEAGSRSALPSGSLASTSTLTDSSTYEPFDAALPSAG